MEHIEKLKELGYEVGVAQQGYDHPERTVAAFIDEDGQDVEARTVPAESAPTVYSVSGHGVMGLHVQEDDEEAWKSLTNAKAHKERARQAAAPEED